VELFTIPAPFMVRSWRAVLIVKLLALGLNAMLLTVTAAESDRSVVLETSKVAMFEEPFGTVAGVQLAAVFQSLLVGLRFKSHCPRKRSRR